MQSFAKTVGPMQTLQKKTLDMTEKKTSIGQMAKRLGVSSSTVSRALSGHSAISEAMIEKVRKLAKELNYVPNQMAIGLKSGKHNMIGVIVPTISRRFFASVIEGIEDYAHSKGCDVLICQSKNSNEREKKLVHSMRGKVDGVIASLSGEKGDHDHFNELGIPLVLFDRVDSSIKASKVTVDDFNGGVLATQHLLDEGFRRIYHFCGPQHVNIWGERHRGYLETMKKAGIEVSASWVYEATTTEEEGQNFASQVVASGELPDAIFFSGDYAALGAMAEFKECGLDIPMVGFANEPFCDYVEPKLSSVNQHSARMGSVACKMLLDVIDGAPLVNTVITPDLVVRNSSLKRV